MEEAEDLFLKNVTVEAVEEHLIALRNNTYSVTQGPGLEIKTKSQLTCCACVTSHPLSLACRNFNTTRQSIGNDVVKSVLGLVRNRPVPICFFGPCCLVGTSCLCIDLVWGRKKRKENHNVKT